MKPTRPLVFAAIILFIASGFFITSSLGAAPQQTSVVVLATSDVHGSIRGWDYCAGNAADTGLSRVSTLVKRERESSGNVILLDGGDFLQGTPLTAYYAHTDLSWKIHPVISAFNTMKYDAIALGNHEFNFGTQYLSRAIASSGAAVIAANIKTASPGGPWAPVKPWIIKKFIIGGIPLQIGIIGVITPAIPRIESPENYKNLVFTPQEDAVNQSIAEMREKGVTTFIVVTHSGVETPRRPYPENCVVHIAENCPGVSLIISGHDHALIDNSSDIKDEEHVLYPKGIINGVPVISPKSNGENLSKAILSFYRENGSWKIRNVTTSNLSVRGVPEDPQIISISKTAHDNTIRTLKTKIAYATGDFTGTESDRHDTALIDLINNVQLHYSKADISAAASFNTKALIPRGDITYQDIYSAYIYENYLCAIRINGNQLKQYLEKTAEYFHRIKPGEAITPENLPTYYFDMIQGIQYTIDITEPTGSRIKNLQYQGKPVRRNDSFTLALNNYRLSGGGGYMKALGYSDKIKPVIVWDSQRSFGEDGRMRTLIANYVKEKK